MLFERRYLRALCRCLFMLCVASVPTASFAQTVGDEQNAITKEQTLTLARQMLRDARQWAERGWSEPARRLALRAQRLRAEWPAGEASPADLLAELNGVRPAAHDPPAELPNHTPGLAGPTDDSPKPITLEHAGRPTLGNRRVLIAHPQQDEQSSLVAMSPQSIALIDVHMAPQSDARSPHARQAALTTTASNTPGNAHLEAQLERLERRLDRTSIEARIRELSALPRPAPAQQVAPPASQPVIVNQSGNALALLCFIAGSLCGIAAAMPWFRRQLTKEDSVMRLELVSPLHSDDLKEPIAKLSGNTNQPRRTSEPSSRRPEAQPELESQQASRFTARDLAATTDTSLEAPIDLEAALLQMAVDNNLSLRRRLAEQDRQD